VTSLISGIEKAVNAITKILYYFFQQNPCKHPIVILKDTGRDEAAAMLEFAYTGEVNVAQDLLPTLLHTARYSNELSDNSENHLAYKIKTDKEIFSTGVSRSKVWIKLRVQLRHLR